jgi:hypothetical protein
MKRLVLILLALCVIYTVNAQNSTENKKKETFKINGSLSVGGFAYQSNGPGLRPQPYGYSMSASLNFSLYGVSIPFYALLNEQGSAFQHPFNRFGISPQYKWAKLHLGWHSMAFSEFTLYNTVLLGAGLELRPKKFRFAAIGGELKAPTAVANINFDQPQFKRRAMGAKIGTGTDKNYIDFMFFKAKDDTTSLLSLPDSVRNKLNAHDNLVIGIQSKSTWWKEKIIWDVDVAGTAFTRDLRMDPLQLDQDSGYQWVQKVFTPNLSSNLTYAGQSSLKYRGKTWGLGVNYRRVMPDYQSLGSAYLLNDIEAITLNPEFSLMKGALGISGSYGIQRNNLDGKRLSTNQRDISSLNINYNPSPYYGVYASYSNYTFQQQVVIDTLYSDSLVINQLTHNFMFVPRWTHLSENWVNNLILTANFQVLNENSDVSSKAQNSQMILSNFTYNAVQKKSGMAINSGLSFFNFRTSLLSIQRYGLNVGFGMKVFKKKLSLNSSLAYNYQMDDYSNSSIFTLNGRLSYKLMKKTSLALQFYLSTMKGNQVFNEQRIEVRLAQSF